jgi:hypothetical protein
LQKYIKISSGNNILQIKIANPPQNISGQTHFQTAFGSCNTPCPVFPAGVVTFMQMHLAIPIPAGRPVRLR